jgi:hypothetical protein
MIKYLIIIIALAGVFTLADGQAQQLPSQIKMPAHPRVLLLKDEEKSIRTVIAVDPVWKKMHETIQLYCDKLIDSAALERVQPGVGQTLLNTSRKALRRIFYLSYVYRVTENDKYAQRAKKELVAVCNFSDWNPSHFLDVAEMTLAVSIAYDWLYDKLSEEERTFIRESIIKKGIEPSFDKKYNWFLDATQNWNQVCNAGMTYGALAIWDENETLSRQVIERALTSIRLPMGEYKPDGGYPEGYGYWNYGTSYNVMFLTAIEKVFHDDFGLLKSPGFMKTAGFMENMTGNGGLCFNWADCLLTGTLKPTMFWFAQRNNDPSLLWMEKKYLMEESYSRFTHDRLLPNVMIWGKDLRLDKIKEPKNKIWIGQGVSPVAAMRTSWNPGAIYLGFKGGTPQTGHAHMDMGSFIMESDGVRWASDLGMQNYETLETKGMDIWGKTQDATRWKIFRINSYSHNILTVDSLQQRVDGKSSIDKFSSKPDRPYAISDLTSMYKGQLQAVKRGVAIKDGKYVVVRDEFTTLGKAVTVRWAMLTSADVEITGSNTARLTKDGKTLTLKVVSSKGVKMKTWSTAPTNDYDAENPGTQMIGFEIKMLAGEDFWDNVLLIPGEKAVADDGKKRLEDW